MRRRRRRSTTTTILFWTACTLIIYCLLQQGLAQQIAEQRLQRFGERLTIGRIRVRPLFRVVLSDVVGRDAAEQEPWFTVRRVEAQPSIWSLWSRRLVLGSVVLDEPMVRLTLLPEQKWPWPVADTAASGATGLRAQLPLLIARSAIRDGRLVLVDRLGGREVVTSLDHLEADGTKIPWPMRPMVTSFYVHGQLSGAEPADAAPVEVRGWIDILSGALEAHVNISGAPIQIWQPYLDRWLLTKLQSGRLTIASTWRAEQGELTINCSLRLSDIVLAPEMTTVDPSAVSTPLLSNVQQILTENNNILTEDFTLRGPLDQPRRWRIKTAGGNLIPTLVMRAAANRVESVVLRTKEQPVPVEVGPVGSLVPGAAASETAAPAPAPPPAATAAEPAPTTPAPAIESAAPPPPPPPTPEQPPSATPKPSPDETVANPPQSQ